MKLHQALLVTILCVSTLSLTAQNPWLAIHQNGESTGGGVSPLNGNGTLGNTYNVTKCGLNYVQSSKKVTNRNSTGGSGSGLPCTLTISGLPASCIMIEKAYLWYEESYNISPNTSSPTNPAISVTNPATTVFNYVGTAVGNSGEKCWGENGTRTFRIDVTNAITGNGNYVINTTSYANEIDGMTLFIIYSDYNATYQGSLIINDGIITTNNGSFLASQITGFNACANSSSGKAFAIIGDAQYAGGAPNQSHESILNNSPSTVYNDVFWNFDQTNTNVSAGQTTSNFGITPGQTVVIGVTVDCISWVVEGLYYQTTTCATCPTPLVLGMTSTVGCACSSSATVTPSGVSGPYTYSWAPSGGNAATASNLCSGTYTVTVTALGGCVTNTSTVTITSNPTPVPTANNTGPYCAGQTIQLNSPTGSATDDWAGPGGYTITNTQNPTIINSNPAMSGIYTVTVTNAFGCSATATTTVMVNPVPTANATNTGPYCAGQTVQLNSVGGSTTDDWTGPGGYTSTNTQNPTIVNSNAGMSGIYTVTVTNAFGCTATSTTAVTVNAIPVATANNTGPYCTGATIQLNSSGGTGYNWSGPAGYSNGTQNPGIPLSTSAMSGVYTVIVTGTGGCTSSATTTVTVNNAASATASNTGPYCAGSAINLSSGVGGIDYDWSGPGGYTSANTQNPVIINSTSAMSGTYTVTVTMAGGCTGTATTLVTVNPLPVATASNTGPYCAGSTIQLNSSGGTSYNWSGPAGYSNGTQNPGIPLSTSAMSGVYTVIVTGAGGCTSSATTTVTVNNAASATASNTGPYCAGSAINLSSGAGGIDYDWSGPGGYTSANTQNPIITNSTSAMSGVYTVTVTMAGGCTGTATTTVTVNALPITMASNTGPYCTGATIQLNSSGGTVYNWSGPSGYSNGTQNPSIPSSTPAMSGVYTVTVTNAAGCSATATTMVNVAGSLIISAGSNSPVCDGQSLNLTSTLIAGGTYVWNGPGGYSSGVQNPSINPANLTNTGTYTITITNPSGCSGTATVSATINALPAPTSSNTGPYCAGTTIQLNSTGGSGYAWSGPNSYANGTQNPTISASTPIMSGIYTVTVTNVSGCTSTSTTAVTVNASPTPTATNTGPYCIGSTIQLNSVGGSATDDWAGPGGYTATDTQNPTIANATVGMSGIYTVTVTNAANCSATATTTVIVNANAAATANNTGPYCEGSTINLSSPNGAIDYDWAGPGGYVQNNTQNPTISNSTPAMSGTYTVTITIVGGCTGTATTLVTVNTLPTPTANNTGPYCAGATIQLNSPTGNSADDWAGPSGYAITNTQNPQILNSTVSMNGIYTVTVTDANGCSASATTNVLINPAPIATANNNTPICESGTINFNGNGGANYDWSGPNGFTANGIQNPSIINSTISDGGVYTVTVTDANGCSATATTTAIVNTNLIFTASSNSPICIGNILNLNAQNIAGAIYDWSGPNGYAINNQQNPIIAPVSAAAAGTYTVTATSSAGCSGTATVDVIINPLPNPAFVGDILNGCSPLCVNFADMSTSNGSGIIAWNWNIENQTPTNTQNVNYCFNNAGVYDASLTVTSGDGCMATLVLNDYINVYPKPTALFTFSPGEIVPGNPTVSFTNSSSGATNFLWDFGDGITSTDENPTHTFTTVDTFCVLLTVSNTGGCADTTEACLHYVPDFSFYIPNSFTPNGDESNNVFMVYGLGVRDLMVKIFDRWGREIYHFEDINKGWPGTMLDGSLCQIGVYAYRVEVTDMQNHWHEYMGQVNLIR